ncbi:MAG: RDD family protein [Pseudomonadota bacterium]|nr:RDD family protein [Pseudomonadota bacterium]
MSQVPEGNRFAPPTAHVEDVAISGSGTLAGRWTRLGAALIDGILAGLIFWAISIFTPFNVFQPAFRGGLMLILIENTLAGFAIFLVLHGYLLQSRGQTIGKMLLRIRIVRTDGTRATLARLAGLRYFANSVLALIPVVGWLYGLVDALMIFRTSRKCVHDNLADTIVIKA